LHGVFFRFTVHDIGIFIVKKLTEVNYGVNFSGQEIDLDNVGFVPQNFLDKTTGTNFLKTDCAEELRKKNVHGQKI
jgi:hypothetical protein